MHSPFDCSERYAPGNRYLRQRVTSGKVHEGGHRNRMTLQVSNYGEDFIYSCHLVCFLTAWLVPLAQSLGLG